MEVPCIRVLIAEDFLPFRQFLSSALAADDRMRIVCEVSDGVEAVRKANELRPDLVVIDVGLPLLSGIQAAGQIRSASLGIKILFVSQEASTDVIRAALDAGADGYVIKMDAGRELMNAVNSVLLGERFISSSVVNRFGPGAS